MANKDEPSNTKLHPLFTYDQFSFEGNQTIKSKEGSQKEVFDNCLQSGEVPIVYNPGYDIYFYKVENVHPFDTKKWGKIAQHLHKFFQVSFKKVFSSLL